MNIEKKYYHVTATNELRALKERRSQLRSAASSTLMATMTPFDGRNFREMTGNNPYDGMTDYERQREAARIDSAISSLYPKVLSGLVFHSLKAS
jgi:hypothetical protein